MTIWSGLATAGVTALVVVLAALLRFAFAELRRLQGRVGALEMLAEEQARLVDKLEQDLRRAEGRIKVLEEENLRLLEENARLRGVVR